MQQLMNQELSRARHADLIRQAANQYARLPEEHVDSKPTTTRPGRLRALFARRPQGRPALGSR
jgi:hypothetical protein